MKWSFALIAVVLLLGGCRRKHGDAFKVEAVSARGARACAAMKDGTVRCWGKNGKTSDRAPTTVAGLAGATKACATDDAVCILGKDHFASCMGASVKAATDLACGAQHACAIAGGNVLCWSHGQQPAEVPGATGATSIAMGGEKTCATFEGGAVRCWRDGNPEPALVPGLSAKSICVGGEHACAVLEDQTVACFGSDDDGELGDGLTDASATPKAVPGVGGATSVACGAHHTCARIGDSTVTCWGKNDVHQSGIAAAPSIGPTRVVGLYEAEAVAAGDDFTCALMEDGWVRCFGVNDWGQLGDGTTEIRNVPTPIKL